MDINIAFNESLLALAVYADNLIPNSTGQQLQANLMAPPGGASFRRSARKRRSSSRRFPRSWTSWQPASPAMR